MSKIGGNNLLNLPIIHNRCDLKEIFDLCFIGSVALNDYLTDSSLAVSCSLQSDLMLVVRVAILVNLNK